MATKQGSRGKNSAAQGRHAKGRSGKAEAKPEVRPAKRGVNGKDSKKSKVAGLDVTGADDPGRSNGSFAEALRISDGFVLADFDTRSTPAFKGGKKDGEKALAARAGEISGFQERLYAESKGGGTRSLLLVVQGMDTSGKGGIMRHVVGQMDPQGVHYTAFKAPTAEEKRHPFLWRVRNALPQAGQFGVFDRSHYEDVLIVRVHDLVPRSTWSRRYAQINDFEAKLVDAGTTIIKVMLHLSQDEQKSRLMARLERPDKHWKYNPGDVDERMFWPAYQEAYQALLERTSTAQAPWFVVPADRKWYARLAVQNLVLEHLEAMDPVWPAADFDVEAEKERLAKA
jgi:PPK2 family polyphosphate:nucleotide phosphotransferase